MNDKTADALHRLALEGGSVTAASRALGIPKQTLHDWKAKHREEYERIAADYEDRRDRELADKYHAIARDNVVYLGDLTEKAAKALEQGNIKDAATLTRAMKDAATASGIATQNDRGLRDKPIQSNGPTVNLTLVQRAIAQLEGDDAVETTAIEVEPQPLPPAA